MGPTTYDVSHFGHARAAGLWFTTADVRPFDDALIDRIRSEVTAAYGPWEDTP